jgi:ribosome-associated protein
MESLDISNKVSIPYSEITFKAVRSQGAGGQNVNKVASAIHLFFDIEKSSLPDYYKNRLMKLKDQRITENGVIIIKAQVDRNQKNNKDDALKRLQKLIKSVATLPKKRTSTKPSKSSQIKRLDSKAKHSQLKSSRKRIRPDD